MLRFRFDDTYINLSNSSNFLFILPRSHQHQLHSITLRPTTTRPSQATNSEMSTTNTNPGNFANRDTEEVKAIASMGGKASHGSKETEVGTITQAVRALSLTTAQREDSAAPLGRNPDGTFTKGSEATKTAGQHSHDNDSHTKPGKDDVGPPRLYLVWSMLTSACRTTTDATPTARSRKAPRRRRRPGTLAVNIPTTTTARPRRRR